ncbi:hypothetical protein LQV63_25605 [Paenibacillus profundus]|uniref:Uncharacterized protein n=1 Tax=Paenibacillus profundus TaxID=1173085 RepID=A0ABS8YLE3_9BACL|nr:hypothetical protein [Paenibacillus profundus]MCE5172651.1 hypothetical protein [Paenibacillus profundus]
MTITGNPFPLGTGMKRNMRYDAFADGKGTGWHVLFPNGCISITADLRSIESFPTSFITV